MNIFCLTGHSHQKWQTNLCCMTKRMKPFGFCFKASVCELLGDEYLISWLLLARMHVSGTAMHITISPFSHTSFTYCPLCLPAHPPPTHLVDGRNVTLKKLSSKNHTQAPGGASSTQNMSKTLWKIGLQNQTVRRVHRDTVLMGLKSDILQQSMIAQGETLRFILFPEVYNYMCFIFTISIDEITELLASFTLQI